MLWSQEVCFLHSCFAHSRHCVELVSVLSGGAARGAELVRPLGLISLFGGADVPIVVNLELLALLVPSTTWLQGLLCFIIDSTDGFPTPTVRDHLVTEPRVAGETVLEELNTHTHTEHTACTSA